MPTVSFSGIGASHPTFAQVSIVCSGDDGYTPSGSIAPCRVQLDASVKASPFLGTVDFLATSLENLPNDSWYAYMRGGYDGNFVATGPTGLGSLVMFVNIHANRGNQSFVAFSNYGHSAPAGSDSITYLEIPIRYGEPFHVEYFLSDTSASTAESGFHSFIMWEPSQFLDANGDPVDAELRELPELSTWVMMLSGLGLAVTGRRRRSSMIRG